jgi:hypothetical protein
MKKGYKTNSYKPKGFTKKSKRYKKTRRYKTKKNKKTVRGGMLARFGTRIVTNQKAKEIANDLIEEKLKRTKTYGDVQKGLENTAQGTIQGIQGLINNNENVDPNKKPINMNSFSPEDNSPFVPKKVYTTGSLNPVKIKLFSPTEI